MPYVLVTTGPEVCTTKPVKRGKNFVWNEVFELIVVKNKPRVLEVTVMAREVEGGDDFLGSK